MAQNPILIVDDEPSNLATLKQVLGDLYPLVFARSGGDCLNAVKKHNPSLILLDVQMPDMDGYEVCRRLKANADTQTIPVIFISALGEIDNETTGFESGGVDYIIKPISPATVRARVRTHLSLVQTNILEKYVKQLEIEQRKTARLSRIHSVLSGINSAIVRIQEPQLLFDAACQIAVEQGGFGVAWIGITNDSGANLNIISCRGVYTESINESLTLTSNLAQLTSDIPLRALTKNKAVFCNNVELAADHDRVCMDAHKRGYRSLIALPICSSENYKGVMVLYAIELNYIDDEEIKLLSELAGDISFALQSIENEKKANFLSYYDALTALPNTALFLDRLAQLVHTAKRDSRSVYIIVLNINRFKQVNDSYGRHIGDHILCSLAFRLNERFSPTGSVARIGADNFSLAFEAHPEDDIGIICEELLKILASPFDIDKIEVNLSARMGIATFPEDASDSESLFKNAEAALKHAKEAGKSYLFYSPEINARIAERLDLENMVKRALGGEQFQLYYQPKVSLNTGKIVGAEALIRWIHPERGLVSPGDFIPLAEETGLIIPIGEWVIRNVCGQLKIWLKNQIPMVPVAINLSALQFRESDIYETICTALEDFQISSEYLELELTESLVMHNPEEAEKIMRMLLERGLHLALDDFGTGYSSLAYLKRFPFDTVKIDRAFIADITRNPEDAAIASAIIGMAHSLRMQVVAEGVESEAQMKFLQARHCDQIQGFYFSRPIPAEHFQVLLEDDKKMLISQDASTEEKTLLIVESEEPLVSALVRALRNQGYRLLTSQNGNHALELLALHKIQVILCNQNIANSIDLDFISVVAKLYPETMRILIGGDIKLEAVLDIINRGEIYRFLTKPWSEDLLRQNIKEAFKHYHPATSP